MDKSLQNVCDALKKILAHLKPQNTSLSFVLLIGKTSQGKTTLLRQSHLQHFAVDLDNQANFFYHSRGIVLELGETWFNQSDSLLTHTIKQLNRCHSRLKISGIILCIDSSDLLLAEPLQLMEKSRSHTQLLERFNQALGYPVDGAILFTKVDTLMGFCEFFQSEHSNDLKKPLGFSLEISSETNKVINVYRAQFDQLIEMLSQKIINKLHPERSSTKRTLIREFPLQLASLRSPVQTILQTIPIASFRLKAIYFTSAEQGGLSIDRLNKKIQNDYALMIQDKFPQSHNYQAYFIEGALRAFLQQTAVPIQKNSKQQKLGIATAITILIAFLFAITYQYTTSTQLLDETNKELTAYEHLLNQSADKASALYHLSQAENKMHLISQAPVPVRLIKQLQKQLSHNTHAKLQDNFLPELVHILENTLSDPSQTPMQRYEALKVYMMLGDRGHFSESSILHWFANHWKHQQTTQLNDKPLLLLKNILKETEAVIVTNQQLIIDTRNYLNALPATYLYYSLAKEQFAPGTIPLKIEGFDLAARELPVYFTKEGFKNTLNALPNISRTLQQENWVLARQDLDNLQKQLEETYCQDYVTWWQNFTRRTHPQHYQGYQQARQLTLTLYKTNAIPQLIDLIQQQTSPELGDNTALFNQKIAKQFTNINLMSRSASHELTQNVNELETFLTTLSLVKDHNETVFDLTKARFKGETLTDPLSVLYNRSRQLPEPISSWAKQIADDTWFIFITESKAYLNELWQKRVYKPYKHQIAHRYPLDASQNDDLSIEAFNNFFSPNGVLNTFVNNQLKPFLDTTHPQWQPKELNGYVMPISADILNELIRANVISNMFFANDSAASSIEFSLQKITLDPVVSHLQLTVGQTMLNDNQDSDSYTDFHWPESGAKLILTAIDGNHFELEERGPWAFFKMLQKINVLVDSNDSASLQILFEVNGNSGRYLLKTQNQINPFSPGILTGFSLNKDLA